MTGIKAALGPLGSSVGRLFSGTGGLVLRFVLSAAIGAGGALGVGAATSSAEIRSTAALAPASTFALEGTDGDPVDFAISEATSAPPVPIEPLPETSTIQLVSYTEAIESKVLETGARPPWLNGTVPRVPAITQFDGGPYQGSNCTMASGAMLARLAYGVVATGSQLRALQDNQSPVGTTLGNLGQAMRRGWAVEFFKGAISPLQLRALMYGGAGAVIQGLYRVIPEKLRLQKNFLAGHAIYLDAFRPATADTPAAYFVIDPLGRPWNGYQGEWWPADAIEDFATTFGGGLIPAVWAFPGGVVPTNRPILPLDAYPGRGPFESPPPTGSQTPTETPPTESAPTESVMPSESPGMIVDPMPPDDSGVPPLPPGLDPGTIQPEGPTETPPVTFEEGGARLSPLFIHCISRPTPPDCPAGILGVVKRRGSPVSPAPSASTRPPRSIDLLYANLIGPGMYQIVFKPPPDTTTDLWLWQSDVAGGTLLQAATDEAVIGGREVSVATVFLDPLADYSFVATAAGEGIRVTSPVGSIEVGG
ncbi:MAG TPA: hypothetical protein VEX41_11090 [Candidatus Eisenbacteria bacterium]|nr:hypothetical protein [Candidatus Eisenbacteria bacterium]